MQRYVCIHGHFYQPPRENPWLEDVELQDSAFPYHDWNDRITAESYGPNTAARILDADGRIVEIANNFARISFNVGPTLLSWMERHRPHVYHAILEADRLSRERFSGHGSALAQVYNHMIMPLANRRDRYTQTWWGIKDFEARFNRAPEGMWLPETGVDLDTLETLAELGIRFTLVAPNQIKRVRAIVKGRWHEVGAHLDPTMPYLCRLPSGRSIALFVYDGPIARDVAFGGLLNNGEALATRLLQAFDDRRDRPQIVHIATDGETYGHHHRHGDMALAYALHFIESRAPVRLTNYGEYLDRHPPTHLAEIHENSSWSCVHGVERWRADCGCNSGGHPGWTQKWRAPLREAMNWLRDEAAGVYGREAADRLTDPWAARNDYIEVLLDRSAANVERFLARHTRPDLAPDEKPRVLKLLEMQRSALLMFTSCGWFFDELSGIETVQVMQYAGRAIGLIEDLIGVSLEAGYLQRLAACPSNVYESGARAYELLVRPLRVDLLRVGAHYAVTALFEDYPETAGVYAFSVTRDAFERHDAGRLRLVLGRIRVQAATTGDESRVGFAALHLGDHNIHAGVRPHANDVDFDAMEAEMLQAFDRGDLPETMRLIGVHFGTHTYSLRHLFKDAQRKVLDRILRRTLDEIGAAYGAIHDQNFALIQFLRDLRTPLPKPLRVATEFSLNARVCAALETEPVDLTRLEQLLQQARGFAVAVDGGGLELLAHRRIDALFERFAATPNDAGLLAEIERTLSLLAEIPLEMDLWQAQNRYYAVGQRLYAGARARAESGSTADQHWIELFRKLGYRLGVRIV